MERPQPETEALRALSNGEVTRLVTDALFYLYEFGKTPVYSCDIAGDLSGQTGIDYDECVGVVEKMQSQNYLMPKTEPPDDGEPEIVFGTKGLWLLEDGFMHGEESVDSMALAERILARDGFFA